MSANKTVLITGATRGLGFALAVHYKEHGWNVIAAARDLDKADKIKEITPYKLVQLDAADEASILHAAKQLEGETIDLLINNAGIMELDSLQSVTKDSLMRQYEIGTVGPFLVTRAFLPHLRAAVAKHDSARVVHMGSYLGSITLNDGGVMGTGLYGYRAAKTGLNMINACLALDLSTEKITTIALHPGYVRTEMNGGAGFIDTDESVAGMTKVIAGIKAEDGGKFFSYDGTSLPW